MSVGPFDEMVKPVLLYGCEIWGMGNNDILERVHLTFCKLLLNLKTSTPSYMVYGELGRYLSFWTKLCCGKESKLSAIMYKLCFQMSVVDRCNCMWLNKISNILNECGMSNIWNTQNLSKFHLVNKHCKA